MASIRGRAACDGCRSRKQKCDETKPVCSRCRDSNKSCVWPKVHKRGPVKGYSELLKQRLDITENALLRLLDAVDDGTIDAAFRSNSVALAAERAQGGQSTASTDAPGNVEVKKAELTAQWDQFPLRTGEDVKRWAKEVRSVAVPSPVDPDIPESRSETRMDSTYTHLQPVQSSIEAATADVRIADGELPEQIRLSGVDFETFTSYADQVLQGSAEAPGQGLSMLSHFGRQEEDEGLELSEEFKQQYLW